MKLTFLGGADEVGASCTLVEIGGKTILIDAGIRISPRTNRGIRNDQLPDLYPISEAGGPDFILVTHAHTDHTGALPLVLEQYPDVPVMGTRPTIALTRILQVDAQHIMQSRHEQEGELPIFDDVASQRLLDAFQTVEFNQPIYLGDGVQVTYYPSGHIAGAAMLLFESEEGVLVMSGDLSLSDQRAVVQPTLPNVKADALVLESTYGGKMHANRVAEEKRLIATLQRVIERGGKVLIPAFALGRSQEIVQIILAYRDQFDAPVYVDGMVRSVCDAYATFADLLPVRTVKMAGEQHLFFREKVRPVRSAKMREEIARSSEPLVIVASSGMMTGGASVVYARHFAPDPRNAILLTGYQDEESPGRAMQRLIKERQAGDFATIKLDGKSVTVNCEVDTYSLSAHADESELLSIADALGAEEIMLVHGDPSARHSLGTGLRQRGKRVILPQISSTHEFAFAKRPWALGRVKAGKETRPFDPKALWERLQQEGQGGQFFSAKELAQMWWGDANRAAEVQTILTNDRLYFAPDWRKKDTFKVRTPDDMQRVLRRRQIMMAHPDIVGKLIVMRNKHGKPRLAVVRAAGETDFEAEVHGQRGTKHPADALLWVIGDWQGYGDDEETRGSTRSQLAQMTKAAKALREVLLPFDERQKLVEAAQPVNPETLLPPTLPEGVSRELALTAIVMALGHGGATLEPAGILPQAATESGALEQNAARELALKLIPSEARLRKVGMDVPRRVMTLQFDFPDVAAQTYSEQIEQLAERSGWDVQVKQGANQQALADVLYEILPQGAQVVKGPSFYLAQGEVQAQIEGVADPQALVDAYQQATGFHLVLAGYNDSEATPAPAAPPPPAKQNGDRMEINAAYGVIRAILEPLGLYKAGLKGDAIVLSFISPQIGQRHAETITQLSEATGYPLQIHPHPNQQMILQTAKRLLAEAGWEVRKGPGIHIDRAEVSVALHEPPDEAAAEALSAALEEQTGYRLVWKV